VIDLVRLRDFSVREFFDAHRRVCLIAGSSTLGLVVLLLVAQCAISGDAKRAEAERAVALAARAIPPDELFLPLEPLSVPGIRRFREPHVVWTAQEAKKWYTVPDEKMLGELRSASRKPVDELLESVP
jgi:hypothetical protein